MRNLQNDLASLRDFELASARLRITFKTYPRQFGSSVRDRDRAALRKLMQLSNRSRDALAQLALLGSLQPGGPNDDLVGALESDATVPKQLLRRFRELEARLRRRIRTYRVRLDPDRIPAAVTFQDVARQAALGLVPGCTVALATIDLSDMKSVRKVVMHAQQLRDTLDPMRAGSTMAIDSVARLDRLQVLLSSIRDTLLMQETIKRERKRLPESDSAQMEELREGLHRCAAPAHTELRQLWLDGNSKWFFERILQGLQTISRPVAAPPIPPRRPAIAGSPWRGPSSV